MIRFAPELEIVLQMSKKTLIGAGLILVGMVLTPEFSKAQSKEVELANEYYGRRDMEKSLELYDKLAKDMANTRQIYANYTAVLTELKLTDKMERYLKKVTKTYPEQIEFKVDFASFYAKAKKQDKADIRRHREKTECGGIHRRLLAESGLARKSRSLVQTISQSNL
jgi:hypothetical protein